MAAEGDELPVPNFVTFPLFPFEGDLRVKRPPPLGEEWVRQGDPGGAPCRCPTPVEEFIWYDDTWAVRAGSPRPVVQLFLETRAHVDIEQLSDEEAAGLGRMIVRIERAIRATGDIGRVHVHRWGDGSAHFHMWFFGRPKGATHLLGFGMSMWADILPPMPEADWNEKMRVIAQDLATGGGTAVL
jgi:diadenosine tetraphosphate (Ap4A) HIT family hydrolase